jgi:hypothetical protein
MGFWNFTLGTALAVLFACYARRHWQDWTAARTAVLMVAAAVIVATHIIPALFFSYLLLLLLLESPTGNLQPSLPSPRHRAVIAVAIVPIVSLALYATKNHSHAAIFNTSPRGILQAILYYPSTAFDVIRVPYVDAEYATAALALVVLVTAVIVFTKRGVPAIARSPYFAGGSVMLLASIVLNDGQGGGAFLQGRLALFSFTLFVAWALAESPGGPLLSVATMLIVVSGAFGVMALITQFRDLDAYTKEVMGAIQAVNPRPGARFVTVRYETPTIEKTYGMQRLRMPYLAAEAVGWDADPDKIVNMTTVEPTTIVFPVHLRLPDSCLMEIQAMAEVSIDGHSHDLEQFLACTPIDNVVVVGEYGADWMPRPDEPGLFGVLERGGFVLAGIQGNPPYIRIFAKAPQSN